MKSTRIASLDGLRAISIALVIANHIARGFSDSDGQNSLGQEFVRFFRVGHLGVMIFFVISGFLITTLLLKEDRVNLSRFYFRRTMRIFPPFYAYLTFIVLFALATGFMAYRANTFVVGCARRLMSLSVDSPVYCFNRPWQQFGVLYV